MVGTASVQKRKRKDRTPAKAHKTAKARKTKARKAATGGKTGKASKTAKAGKTKACKAATDGKTAKAQKTAKAGKTKKAKGRKASKAAKGKRPGLKDSQEKAKPKMEQKRLVATPLRCDLQRATMMEVFAAKDPPAGKVPRSDEPWKQHLLRQETQTLDKAFQTRA